MANVNKAKWKTWSKMQQKNQNSKEKMQMKTRIEKMSLETLGAVEREREREREYLTNNYVNYLLKQASFSDAQNQIKRDSERTIKCLWLFVLSLFITWLENN